HRHRGSKCDGCHKLYHHPWKDPPVPREKGVKPADDQQVRNSDEHCSRDCKKHAAGEAQEKMGEVLEWVESAEVVVDYDDHLGCHGDADHESNQLWQRDEPV